MEKWIILKKACDFSHIGNYAHEGDIVIVDIRRSVRYAISS